MNINRFVPHGIYITTLLLLFINCYQIFAQKLPPEMSYSQDSSMLISGVQPISGFYDKTIIRNIYLNFSQPNYWTLLTNNYASETNLPATMVVDGKSYMNVGVRFRGNTSYTRIGNSEKKSFAVETDFTDPDLTFMGYKNLKFNNAHEDATFMREVLYCRLARKYMPIAKANYIKLFLNNVDWGIYANIQGVDKTFLKEWFMSNDGARFRATVETNGTTTPPPGGGMPPTGGMIGGWGDGTAAMNYLGNDSTTYMKYYSLKSSDIPNPWQKLIDACQSLSTASVSTIDKVKEKIDVDKALWFLAAENIFTDDDSYVMKGKMDYYVYYEPETGRTTPLEYDGNTSFQISAANNSAWGPFKNVNNTNYPLLNKLITIPEYRQRYLAHYRTILDETFTPSVVNPHIDEIHAQISSLVVADTKKLYTNDAYSSGITALKNFIVTRRNYLLLNTEVAQIPPTIESTAYYNNFGKKSTAPGNKEKVLVKTTVLSPSTVQKVYLYYGSGVVGNFTKTEMFDDGKHNDEAASDGIYSAEIPGYSSGTMVRFYIEAISNNASASASYQPKGAEHDVFVYTVANASTPSSSAAGVVVNELVASNSNGAKDEAGDFEDWFELYNNNPVPINLGGFYLTDNSAKPTQWKIPEGTIIPANGYLLFWADEEEKEGALHTNFKLSASGESVILFDPSSKVVDQITFPALSSNISYGRYPNGTGAFVTQTPTPNAQNQMITDIHDNKEPNPQISVYPNPASSILTVVCKQLSTGQMISVFNSLGVRIYYKKAEGTINLDVSSYPEGVYFLQVGTTMIKFLRM